MTATLADVLSARLAAGIEAARGALHCFLGKVAQSRRLSSCYVVHDERVPVSTRVRRDPMGMTPVACGQAAVCVIFCQLQRVIRRDDQLPALEFSERKGILMSLIVFICVRMSSEVLVHLDGRKRVCSISSSC